jgi:two-component system sensor histidine kinase/response regulator
MTAISPITGIPIVRARLAASSAHNKVLLLEDDTSFREAIADFLTNHGFEVVAVRNGVEGVNQVLEGDFEVILSDFMMPTLTGDMFYRAVRRIRPHLCDRFIFMTGRRDQAVKNMVASAKAPVLYKPFRIKDLLETIAFVRVRTIQLAA